jgi:hypothetical protein
MLNARQRSSGVSEARHGSGSIQIIQTAPIDGKIQSPDKIVKSKAGDLGCVLSEEDHSGLGEP